MLMILVIIVFVSIKWQIIVNILFSLIYKLKILLFLMFGDVFSRLFCELQAKHRTLFRKIPTNTLF